jgi:hypothetical protein
MQRSTPRPENPCPQEMVITVDDYSLSLNLLLFVRHAWSLAPDSHIPELTLTPDPGASTMPDSTSLAEWNNRWRIAWNRAWDWYKIRDEDRTNHPTQEIMREVFQPCQELHPVIPPLWTTEYDWDGLDRDAFHSWDKSLSPLIPTDEERRNLSDVIPAWESGMDTVIVLPYAGYFAKRITRLHLAVSAATRNEPADYSRALRESTRS